MDWLNAIVQGILLGGLYALYGTGLSLIFGVMRIVNLAHGDFIVLAAYLSLVVTQIAGLSPFATILAVVPLLFVFGYVLQKIVLNRALTGNLLPPVVITFGISIILQNALQLVFSPNSQGLDAGSLETASLQLGRLNIGWVPLITLITAIVVLAILQLFLTRTAIGRAFRATSDNPGIAELMGINSRQIYGIALGLSLAIVALAGILLGIRTNFAPAEGPARLLFAFETVIIGGLGNLWGTLIGGVILGIAQVVGASFNPGWFQLAGHVVTLLVLAFLPSGLFPRTREL